MATMLTNHNATTKYKSCPLKKRPVVYEEETLPAIDTIPTTVLTNQYYTPSVPQIITIKQEPHTELQHDEQPQDLSLKRKASVDFEDYAFPAKREFVLDLSKDKYEPATTTTAMTNAPAPPITTPNYHLYRPDSPAHSVNSHHSELGMSSALLSPPVDHEMEYYQQQQPPTDIHLRGLTAGTSGYTTASINYKSAFMVAAGATPMTALWSAYQPGDVGNLNTIFPSPATSIATSPRSAYSYQHITPPSSPGSEAGSEPEDLTIRNDIPLPALYHNSAAYCNITKSQKSSSSGNNNRAAESSTSATGNSNAIANKHANYRYKCDKCNKMYSTSIGLSKHQQFHCPAAECNQDKKQHSCHECGKLYNTIGALKMHIRTHTLPCKCPICGKAFSRPWLLQGHIRTHTGEKPFQCNDCPRSFADRSNLRAHQQTHVDVKKYACKVCNKSFSRMSLLNKHVSSNCTITIA